MLAKKATLSGNHDSVISHTSVSRSTSVLFGAVPRKRIVR